MSDKKKKEQLTEEELEQASGGVRGPGGATQADGTTSLNEATPTRMGNRPINISRTVQGTWNATSTQNDGPDGTDPVNEIP